MVSIGLNELGFSPSVAKGWRQKEIIPFVSETTESACIIITDIIMTLQNRHFCQGPEGDKSHWTERCQACLILSKCYLLQWFWSQLTWPCKTDQLFFNHLVTVMQSNAPSLFTQWIFLATSLVLWPSSNL